MQQHKCLTNWLARLAVAVLLLVAVYGDRAQPELFSIASLVSASDEVVDPHALDLPLGKSSSRRISAAEVHTYHVTLNTGQALQLTFSSDMPVRVSLVAPNHQKLLERDCRMEDQTPITLIAKTNGRFQLQFRSSERGPSSGNYELVVDQIHEANDNDHQRFAAELLAAEAEAFLQDWKFESSRKAIQKLEMSLTHWQAIEDKREAARTLDRIGDIHHPLGEYRTALSSYEKALAISRELRDTRLEGETRNKLGFIYIILGDTRKARDLCSQALVLSRDNRNRRGEAQALSNLGEVAYGLGELSQSLAYYEQALTIWSERADRQGQASVLLNAGYTHSDLGQVREAIDSYTTALTLWQDLANPRGQALALSALGRVYSRTGQSQKALDHFGSAMLFIQQVGDPIEEARTLNGIAYLYHRLGNNVRSLSYYDRALPLFRSARYTNGEASTLGDMGRVYHAMGQNAKALESHQQALEMFRAVSDKRMEMVEIKEIGRVFDSAGDHAKAMANYQVARKFYRAQMDLRGAATTLNLIGRVYEKLGQEEKALESYRAAVTLSSAAEDPFARSASLYNIAHLERGRGNLANARTQTEAALEIVESLRTDVGSQDLRASYFASVREHYELYIDILMRLHKERPTEGFATSAFEVSERARARSLLELLKEARMNIREGADAKLLERERSLQQLLNAKADRRMQLIGSKNTEEAEVISREISQLTSEYDDVRVQLKKTSPRYAALTQPQPLKLQEIQQQILDDESVLLEYVLGEEKSYVWAVTRTSISSFELASRVVIEDSARRLYTLLTENTSSVSEELKRSAAFKDATASLSHLLLDSVANELQNKRLLIVPDGALQYVPFQVLNSPLEQVTGSEPVPLVVNHVIVNEPSASTLAVVLREQPRRRSSSKTIAVFADPVFDADDPRVRSTTGPAPAVMAKTEQQQIEQRDPGMSEGVPIPRLQASREEAEAIMTVVPLDSGLKAINFDASRATVMRANLGQYRFVHFATHGVLDDQNPEFSGIVLSMVDHQGRPQNGFLRLHDIYNLELPVDLVVLSACNGALGKDVKGEGLIGLTRGFMYAGASGVVASLWKVDDEATAQLMKHFYEAMFKKQLSPAAALRDAQLAMRRQKHWQAPYFWSGFVIQGQYRERAQSPDPWPKPGFRRVIIGAGIGGLLLATFFALRRRRGRII